MMAPSPFVVSKAKYPNSSVWNKCDVGGEAAYDPRLLLVTLNVRDRGE
jgi:hypothetical protein